MKKQVVFLFNLAALVIGPVAMAGVPPATPKGPGFHGQQVTASAGGGVCGQHGDTWRCRSFSVSEYREPTGHFQETRVSLDQEWQFTNGDRWYRHVDCPVPRQAFRVMPDKAFVEVTFDADSPECVGYGEKQSPSTPPEQWRWEGMQTLEADLLAPAQQDRRVTSYTYEDNEAGTSSRQNCHGGLGWNVQGGGFTMYNIYRAFGPGDADGWFFYDTCGTTNK